MLCSTPLHKRSICGQRSAVAKKGKRGWKGQPQVWNSSVLGGIGLILQPEGRTGQSYRHQRSSRAGCERQKTQPSATRSRKAPAQATPRYSREWNCRFIEHSAAESPPSVLSTPNSCLVCELSQTESLGAADCCKVMLSAVALCLLLCCFLLHC